jgi:hypothetical protein
MRTCLKSPTNARAPSGRITRHSDIGLDFLRRRCSWPEVVFWEMGVIARQ